MLPMLLLASLSLSEPLPVVADAGAPQAALAEASADDEDKVKQLLTAAGLPDADLHTALIDYVRWRRQLLADGLWPTWAAYSKLRREVDARPITCTTRTESELRSPRYAVSTSTTTCGP